MYCKYPQEGLNMCKLCDRNVTSAGGTVKMARHNYVPHVVGDDLECDGFIGTELKTVKKGK